MDINTADVLMQMREAVKSEPRASPEPAEPPVCTLFEHCKGCRYPAHGFVCWSGDCIRQTMRKIYGIEEEKLEN